MHVDGNWKRTMKSLLSKPSAPFEFAITDPPKFGF